jgi:hypothetical protein
MATNITGYSAVSPTAVIHVTLQMRAVGLFVGEEALAMA